MVSAMSTIAGLLLCTQVQSIAPINPSTPSTPVSPLKPSIPCELHPDCGSCTLDPPCGWCGGDHFRDEKGSMKIVHTAHCTEGTPEGPLNGFCGGGFTFSSCSVDGGHQVPCEKIKDCAKCTATDQCGWCEDTETCHAGDSTCPFEGQCVKWDFAYCPGSPCKNYFSCNGCTADPFCGWCHDTGVCTEQADIGKMGGCAAYSSDYCNVVDTVAAVRSVETVQNMAAQKLTAANSSQLQQQAQVHPKSPRRAQAYSNPTTQAMAAMTGKPTQVQPTQTLPKQTLPKAPVWVNKP